MSELSVFKSLAFCWDVFESDGLNDELIAFFLEHLAGNLLVIGSGQGIVSRALIDRGYSVDSIELLEEMASFAAKRRKINSTVSNFLTTPIERRYRSVIVNTGVILPSMSIDDLGRLFNNLHSCISDGGCAIVAYFERSEFDDFIEEYELDRSESIYEKLWDGIQQGRAIEHILADILGQRCPAFQYKKYHDDLSELQYQIKESGIRFQKQYPEQDVRRFIKEKLKYTPFGLSRKQQITLHQCAEQTGFSFVELKTFGKTNVAVLRKGSLS